MRVLYSFPDVLGKPGIGTTALRQVSGLAERGIELSVFCTSTVGELPPLRRLVRTLGRERLRVPHGAIGVARAYRYHDWRVARALPRLATDIDVVHCWPRASVLTCRAARALGVPVVREAPSCHTGYVFDATAREAGALGMEPPPGHSHSFDAERLAEEEREFREADYLLAHSEFARSTFVARGVPADKVLVHRNGADLEDFHPNGARAGRDGGPLTALFLGRAEPIKGLHYALRAWGESGVGERCGRLLVSGRFVPGYREALRELIDQPGVELLGHVPSAAAAMREADVFVAASVVEGSALVTYEAQACGCVPLVSDATGARCEHLATGLVHPAGDVRALAEHLRLVDGDRALLDRLRRRMLAERDQLDWSAAAADIAAAYEHCATT
jgi:glycosyltransferase involved in cell wall biosynthesis